jgi:Uma2 family endonuclease
MTAEQLLTQLDLYKHCELIQGELVTMSPAGFSHGEVTLELGRQLANHVRAAKSGKTSAAETGFLIEQNPDTVLAPDAAFIAIARLPAAVDRKGFLPLAPDFVAEVISPNDRFSKVIEKADRWLAAGVKMVLIVDPETKSVRRFTGTDHVDIFDSETPVDCSAAVPGFILNTVELFED